MVRLWPIALGTIALWALRCSGAEESYELSNIFDVDAATPDGRGGTGFIEAGVRDGPPPADATDLCGNVVVQITERINLYWVLDRSGSMADRLEGTAYSKYVGARFAIADTMRRIGHRVSVGAGVFPRPVLTSAGCSAGGEVFETRPGDPASFGLGGKDGPVLQELLLVLGSLPTQGGTPVSGTLKVLEPIIAGLTGKTAVVLATDGAPNCNETAACGAEKCLVNLMGQCPVAGSCCDPDDPNGGPTQCLDDDATLAGVRAIADSGATVYVVGMPGSEIFASMLDDLAVAGGAPREGSPKYYAASNADDLTSQLAEIGTAVAVQCEIQLEDAPVDPSLVNVYLDTTLVPSDAENGWSWRDDRTIQLSGNACDDLRSGTYAQVQVAAGCPTFVP